MDMLGFRARYVWNSSDLGESFNRGLERSPHIGEEEDEEGTEKNDDG